jgi:uncharacterized protein
MTKGTMRKLILAILAILVLATMFQDRLIFIRQPISTYSKQTILPHFQGADFHLETNGARLHGWLLEKDSRSLIFYYGGNGEEVSFNLPDFQNRFTASALLMNYRGYGESTGKPSEKNLYADALSVYDAAISKLQPAKIIVIGRSLGTGVATYLAKHRKCDAMVLITPFDSLQSVASSYYPFLPVSLLLRHKFRSDLNVPDLKIPTLILAAQDDQIIDASHTQRLIEQFTVKPKVVNIADAGHNNIQQFPIYWSELQSFIDSIEL